MTSVRAVPSDFSFRFGGHLLRPRKSIKLLGTTIDSCLSWNEQIDAVCSRLNQGFYVISSLKNSLHDRNILLNVYYAFVHSALSYNIIVWGQAVDIRRVFIIQKRIIRLIFNLPYDATCRDTFKKYNILTVTSIYILKLLVYTHKNRLSYQLNGDFHDYNTRARNNISLAKHTREAYKKTPVYSGSKIFNMMPERIRGITSPITFKTKVKKILTNNVFYTLEEFLHYLSHNV